MSNYVFTEKRKKKKYKKKEKKKHPYKTGGRERERKSNLKK